MKSTGIRVANATQTLPRIERLIHLQGQPAINGVAARAASPFSRSVLVRLAHFGRVQRAQIGFENVTVIVLGQFGNEPVVLRPLEPGDGFQAQRIQRRRPAHVLCSLSSPRPARAGFRSDAADARS